MSVMYIIRGVPGSGKTSLAEILERDLLAIVCEADDYFYNEDNEYVYDKSQINEAHKYCFDKVHKTMMKRGNVIISNTSSEEWELQKYIDLANDFGYDIQIITLQSTFSNIHDVPREVLDKFDKKFVYKKFDLER